MHASGITNKKHQRNQIKTPKLLQKLSTHLILPLYISADQFKSKAESMRCLIILSFILFIATSVRAFTPGTHRSNRSSKPVLIGSKIGQSSSRRRSSTSLSAAEAGAPKKKKAKKATKKKAKAVDDEEEVVTFRKPEFVSRIAEKTGMSKADSEAALSAVLETITEVGFFFFDCQHEAVCSI